MLSRTQLLIVFLLCLFPVSASAGETGFFTGIDVTAGKAFGSSDQTNGGAPAAGGGIVKNVKLNDTIGLGGHLGYRFDNAVSVSLGYQHIWGDVSWDANFPAISYTSTYDGTAISDAILVNLSYDIAVSDTLSITPAAGIGLTFNSFSGVTERSKSTGQFLSSVGDDTKISPAAQVGLGFGYKIAQSIRLDINSVLAYTGEFQTGSTRRGNLGVTGITPYEIGDVWRASLGASINFKF